MYVYIYIHTDIWIELKHSLCAPVSVNSNQTVKPPLWLTIPFCIYVFLQMFQLAYCLACWDQQRHGLLSPLDPFQNYLRFPVKFVKRQVLELSLWAFSITGMISLQVLPGPFVPTPPLVLHMQRRWWLMMSLLPYNDQWGWRLLVCVHVGGRQWWFLSGWRCIRMSALK